MERRIRRLLINCLYGFGAYSMSQFIRSGDERKEILICIGIAMTIGILNEIIMTPKLYSSKYLRNIVQLCIVNAVLIGVSMMYSNGVAKYLIPEFWIYLLFVNVFLIALYNYLYYTRRKLISNTLAAKVQQLNNS